MLRRTENTTIRFFGAEQVNTETITALNASEESSKPASLPTFKAQVVTLILNITIVLKLAAERSWKNH